MIEQIAEGIFTRKIGVPGENWPLITYLWVTSHYNLYLDAGLGENAIRDVFMFVEDRCRLDISVIDSTGTDADGKEALKLGFVTSVTTNGLLLADRAEELKGLIRLPRLSLDSAEHLEGPVL